MPPGASLRAMSPASSGWTRRRLWWRFFGQGSGKKRWIAARLPSATICSSTSTASWRITRTLCSFSRSIAFSRLPTPGPWTSTATNSASGCAFAMAMVVSPMPEPISSTRGRGDASFSAENATPYFGNSSSSARFCAGVFVHLRLDRIVGAVHHHLEAFVHQLLGGLERLGHVRIQRVRIAQHLELHQLVPVEQLAREAQRAHRVLRRIAAGGIGQIGELRRRQRVEQARLAAVLAHC